MAGSEASNRSCSHCSVSDGSEIPKSTGLLCTEKGGGRMNLDHHLQKQLKALHLGGVSESLDLRLQQAQNSSNSWSRMRLNEGRPRNFSSGSPAPLSKKKRASKGLITLSIQSLTLNSSGT